MSASSDPAARSADRPYNSDGVSGASRRLRALAALSGSLTDALTPTEAANLVEQKALSALDATSAVVVTLGAFPPPPRAAQSVAEAATLHVVHAIGLPTVVTSALEAVALDAPVPFAEVARQGEPLFLPDEQHMRRYPHWAEAMIEAGLCSAAIVPVWANGELRGVLGLAWPGNRVFDEDERAFVLTLGVMCAQAIMRAHLRAAERSARDDADVARIVAEHANRSKADFVATISHELRTPINAVMGYTELLTDEIYGPVTVEQREHLSRVRVSGQHLMGLIEDLLSFARVDSGHETIHTEPVRLSLAVDESMAIVTPLARAKRLAVRVERPADDVTLYTDARKLRQIMVNVLANAVKYSTVGEIALVIVVDETKPPVSIRFAISDHGVGMDAQQQQQAFEPFWRADRLKSGAGGTGLGLSVARHLARLLGGDLVISESEPGKGTTVVLTLPLQAGPATDSP